jgi:hypothetical protein
MTWEWWSDVVSRTRWRCALKERLGEGPQARGVMTEGAVCNGVAYLDMRLALVVSFYYYYYYYYAYHLCL